MSTKSNDGNDSKRLRELSLYHFMTNAPNMDVCIESLKSEDCVAILYSCMKKLEGEMKKVLQMCGETKESQTKGESQLN